MPTAAHIAANKAIASTLNQGSTSAVATSTPTAVSSPKTTTTASSPIGVTSKVGYDGRIQDMPAALPVSTTSNMSTTDFINYLAGQGIISNGSIAQANQIASQVASSYNPATGQYSSQPGVINASNLNLPPTTALLPTPPTKPTSVNTFLASTGNYNPDGSPIIKPTVTPTTEVPTIASLIKDLGGVAPEMQPKLDRQSIENQAGLPAIQARVKALGDQIGSINANLQADLQQLRGTGSREGVTEAVYGGQQNELNREATVKLLPLTAMYQAESGNLTAAKELVATYIADENAYQANYYKYRSDLYNNIKDIATNEQQRQMDALKTKDAKDLASITANNNLKNTWSGNAFDAGQSSVAGAILKLDPKSPTFQSDLAALTGQIATNNTVASYQKVGDNTVGLDKFGNVVTTLNGANTPTTTADYNLAAQFVKDNPNATPAELEAGIRQYTKLTEADIKFLVGQGASSTKPFLSADYFEKLFSDQELKTAADTAGYRSFWTPWSSEKTSYLAHLMDVVNQYRLAGMSDNDILKAMQK
jgi:hypothetical protein